MLSVQPMGGHDHDEPFFVQRRQRGDEVVNTFNRPGAEKGLELGHAAGRRRPGCQVQPGKTRQPVEYACGQAVEGVPVERQLFQQQ